MVKDMVKETEVLRFSFEWEKVTVHHWNFINIEAIKWKWCTFVIWKLQSTFVSHSDITFNSNVLETMSPVFRT